MQRSRKITTKINVIFQYIQIALNMFSGIFLIPFYLKFIPVDVYGAWLATGNILIWITIVNPGIANVIMQRIAEAYGQLNFAKINNYLNAGLFLTLLLSIAILLVGLFFSSYIPSLIKITGQHCITELINSFILALLGTSIMVMAYTVIAINYGLQASLSIGVIYVFGSISKIVSVIVLLYCGYGLISIPLAEVINSLVVISGNTGYLIWRLIDEKIGIKLSGNGIHSLAKLVSFTFGSRISKIVVKNVDLFFIARFLGPESVAIYSLTGRAPKLGETFIEHPVAAFRPAVSHLIGSGEMFIAKKVILRLSHIIIWLCGLLLTGFLILNESFVNLWVGSDLYAGQTIGILICFVFLFRTVTNCMGSICFALGNIKGNSIAEFVQSCIYLMIFYVGIKFWGLIGVVLTPIISISLVSLWYYPYVLSKILKFNIENKRTLTIEAIKTGVCVFFCYLLFCGTMPSDWAEFAIDSLLIVFVFLFFHCFFSSAFKTEINKGIMKLKKWKYV